MEILQPKLRFPEFMGHWERKTLGDLFSIFNGYAFSSSDSIDDGVLWVKIADVGIQEMKKDNLSFLPNEYIEKHKKFILKKDDYVIALTRPILNGKLKIAKIDDFFNCSLLNQRVGKLITSHNSTFVFNILQKDLLIKSIENNISGSDPPNLSPNEISFIETFIPVLEEQTRIANFLSSVDEKLNLLKEKKSLLEEYKKGIMQKIFNQEIRFKDDNGKDFEEWEEKNLGEVTSITIGEFVIKTRQNPNGKYPVYNGGKSCTGYYDEFNNDGNKIVISARGANAGFVNFEKGKFWAGNSCYSVGVLDKYHFEIIYFYYYVKFNENTFTKNQQAANIPSVSKKDVEKFSIKIPSLEEQTKIANFLSAIDEKIELVFNQIQDTQEYKKGLLQQMFV